MNTELIVKNSWDKAKNIPLPYDGTATEIFITILSVSSFSNSIELIAAVAKVSEIISSAGESLAVPKPLTAE